MSYRSLISFSTVVLALAVWAAPHSAAAAPEELLEVAAAPDNFVSNCGGHQNLLNLVLGLLVIIFNMWEDFKNSYK